MCPDFFVTRFVDAKVVQGFWSINGVAYSKGFVKTLVDTNHPPEIIVTMLNCFMYIF